MLNPVTIAAHLVSRVIEIAASLGLNLGEASGFTAAQLTSAVETLAQRVEQAYAFDKDEAESFWIELGELWEHGWNYWSEKQKFDDAVAQLKQAVDADLESIRTLIVAVQDSAGHVPDELDADAEAWQQAAGRIDQTRSNIDALRQIPGWRGGAAQGYEASSVVQGGATEELAGVARSMASALAAVANFNRALFVHMDEEIEGAGQTIVCLAGGGRGTYYLRTSNAQRLLRQLRAELGRAARAEPVRDSATELQNQVRQTLASPALLAPGSWPTGGEQAQVPPSDTSNIPNPDEVPVESNPSLPSIPGSGGIRR